MPYRRLDPSSVGDGTKQTSVGWAAEEEESRHQGTKPTELTQFGIEDQEFMTAFEGDRMPGRDFMHLMG